MSLATVYYHDDRVRASLNARAESLSTVLDEISGRTEWGSKGYADVSAAIPEEPGEVDNGQRPGAAYLSRLRTRRKSRAEAEEEFWRRAQEAHSELDAFAHASRLHPAQNRELAGYEGVMVLNGTYLVDNARTDEFIAAVDGLGQGNAALNLELTGPWPPYSFATFGEEEQ